MADANAVGMDDARLKGHPRENVLSPRQEAADAATIDIAEVGTQQLASLGGTLHGGRGNASARTATIQHAQRLHGNRAIQRAVQRMSAGTSSAAASGGGFEQLPGLEGSAQLEGDVRAFLEQGLGSDLSGVRVHADSGADQLARSVGALAFTTGQDIFFRSGAYRPGSAAGLRVLAHEATHTVQQERGGFTPDEVSTAGEARQPNISISQRSDPSEVEAEKAADRTMSGERAEVSGRATATVSRIGWDDALAMGGGGIIGEVASAFSGPAAADPAAAPPPKDEGMWDKLKRGWSGEAKQEQKRSDEIDGLRHDAIDNTVDWLEGQAHKGGQAGVDATKDIPVLHELAQANAAVGDFGADFAGGFVKGAGGLLGSIGQMAANPIGTAKGLWAMSTHIPGIGLPSKILDKGIDVATGDKKLGDAFDETLGGKSATDDLDFWKGVGGHFLKPYGEAVDKGKYGEVGGRALFDIGSLVLGAGEAKAGTAAKAAEVGETVTAATRSTEAVNAATKSTEAANVATRAAEEAVPQTVRSAPPPGSVPHPPATIPDPPISVPPATTPSPPPFKQPIGFDRPLEPFVEPGPLKKPIGFDTPPDVSPATLPKTPGTTPAGPPLRQPIGFDRPPEPIVPNGPLKKPVGFDRPPITERIPGAPTNGPATSPSPPPFKQPIGFDRPPEPFVEPAPLKKRIGFDAQPDLPAPFSDPEAALLELFREL